MRTRKSNAGITINAIAGTYVVFLGWTITGRMRRGLRGFAIRRSEAATGERYWMKGSKTFASVEPTPAPGEQFSSLRHPFQSFQWADYSALPGRAYRYEVVAMYGPPDALEAGASVDVAVRTEAVEGAVHGIFFNRGSPASQEYARRFHDRPPSAVGDGAYRWLSRGLLESILAFIGRGKGRGWSLRGAFYEFQWPPVLGALAQARDRGVDVRIVFDAIEGASGPRAKNLAAIRAAGIGRLCTKRTRGKIMHDKFLVLSRNGVPQAVLFGSTNLTENGLFGHANCVHVIEGEEPARHYLDYFDLLVADPATTRDSGYKADVEALSPLPPSLRRDDPVAVFSPRRGLDALAWYADVAAGAASGLFMTFAFGMHERFADIYGRDDGILRMALMEKEWNGRNKEAQIAKIRALQRLPNVVIAVGNRIPLGGFDQWLAERDRVTDDVNVHWVHTKFMLVDPLSRDPVVVTGSANFSSASTDTNDENMVVIRGNTRVADIYFGEFFRLHSHYAFRQAVAIFRQKHGGDPRDFRGRFLEEKKDWTADYFTPGDRNARTARRLYFSQAL